jgi:hypothetical protein
VTRKGLEGRMSCSSQSKRVSHLKAGTYGYKWEFWSLRFPSKFKIITFSKISQTQKDKGHVFSYMQNLDLKKKM